MGQALTQRWHAVHRDVKRPVPPDPGGDIGSLLLDFPVGTGRTARRVSLPGRTIMAAPTPPCRRARLRRLTRRGGLSCAPARDTLYLRPTVGQASKQLKQLTQALKSTRMFSLSMHPVLHTFSQRPQSLHAALSITILKSDNLLKRPRSAPAGQSVLQKSLPRIYDIARSAPANTDDRVSAHGEGI